MILKILKWFLLIIVGVHVLIILGLYATNNEYILKGIRVTYLNGHKTAFIDDYTYFDNRKIETGKAQPWPKTADYNSVKSTAVLDSIHKANQSIAYLIIKNDSIWYEQYLDGYSDSSKTNSFSVAKSIVAAALGKALELGHIESIDKKVKDYFPELKGEYADELTVKDLVTMRSGLQWDESYYSPFSITTKAYFYNNLSEAMLELPITNKPNESFKYQSGDTQLLAMVLSKALPMTLSEFVSTYFWKPMGAEHTALWQYTTEDNVEKAYCCIASNAKDFARFGKLYLHNGNWNGEQLLDSAYVVTSSKPAAENSPEYGYGWWIGDYKGKKTVTMNGHLGQYIITIPEDNIIIVRLGHQHDKRKTSNPQSAFYQYINQAYLMLGSN